MLLPIACVLVGGFCLTGGQMVDVRPPIPIITPEPGVQYFPGSTAPIKLEAFFELLCPDSHDAWYELKQVAEHYGPDQLNLVIHQLVLPYHRNAFLCTQGYHYVLDVARDKLWDFMEIILENRNDFGGSVNMNKTEFDVLLMMAEFGEEATGIPAQSFVDNVSRYVGQGVYEWKYSVKRGAAGTAWFAVNGVNIELNPSQPLTASDWIAFLDSLMAGNRK